MTLWQMFSIVAVITLILEMIMPTFFFLNFSIAGFVTAIASIWIVDIVALCVIFIVTSMFSLLLFRPFFIKKFKPENNQTGVESTYYGKIAKVVETITKESGAISIYDERWEARLNSGEEAISSGSEVKIVRNDSLIMYVEKN